LILYNKLILNKKYNLFVKKKLIFNMIIYLIMNFDNENCYFLNLNKPKPK